MSEKIVNTTINARVFRAFYRTLQSEGFSKDEAYELAQRGAELLTASESSASSSPEKPASAAAGGNTADDTSSDSPYAYFFSKLTTTRRLALAALAGCVVLVTFTFLNAVYKLARAPRIERSVGRASDRRGRSIQLIFTTISLLFLIFGLIMFTMPS